jgi:chaperonin GroEL
MNMKVKGKNTINNVSHCMYAGGNNEIGQLIADAMAKVGRQGVVTMEESKTAEDNLYFVEGMQFDRGYYSPYFVTDPERMVCEYENCR